MKELKQTLDNIGFETLPMMTQFIYDLNEHTYDDDDRFSNETLSYRNFITQPLTLSQFVACEDGVPMEEPIKYDKTTHTIEDVREIQEDWDEYQQAVDAVIFEDSNVGGFLDKHSDRFKDNFEGVQVYTVDNGDFDEHFYTIESFINNGGKLKLK